MVHSCYSCLCSDYSVELFRGRGFEGMSTKSDTTDARPLSFNTFRFLSQLDNATSISLQHYASLIDGASVMTAVTVSPKYQVVIPKEVRESLGIVAGQKIQILTYQNRIELIPIKPMKAMRGFLKGQNTSVKRDKDRV